METKLSPLIQSFILTGVPVETIILILMLPIIATLIAFLRQVVGIKAFGIYTPLIITFAFLATNGLRYGVALFLVILFVGMLMRFMLKPFRLLYLPRVAIMLTVVALFILFFLVLGGTAQRTGLASVSIFPIVIMITLVEKFVSVQIEKGDKTALVLAFETLIISIAGFYIASWGFLQSSLLTHPWIILFTIPINIIIGKWTGLRVSEYIRFRNILKKI
ncbi:MAG: 7TM domain-containing protein [Parcubacteria group bacterium]|jgi:hypothetical protein